MGEIATEVKMTITEIMEWIDAPREDLIRIYPYSFIADVYRLAVKEEPRPEETKEMLLSDIAHQVSIIKENPYRLNAKMAKEIYDRADEALSIARMGILDPIANPEYIRDREKNLSFILGVIAKLEEDLVLLKEDMVELHSEENVEENDFKNNGGRK